MCSGHCVESLPISLGMPHPTVASRPDVAALPSLNHVVGCDGCHLYVAGHVLSAIQVANGSKEPPTASENRLHEGRFCF